MALAAPRSPRGVTSLNRLHDLLHAGLFGPFVPKRSDGLLEGGKINGRELGTFRSEIAFGFLVADLGGLALLLPCRRRLLLDNFAMLGREALQVFSLAEICSVAMMWPVLAMNFDLEEFKIDDDVRHALHAVDDAVLDRQVGLAERHADRVRAEQAEGAQERLRFRGADLLALHVVERLIGLLRVRT